MANAFVPGLAMPLSMQNERGINAVCFIPPKARFRKHAAHSVDPALMKIALMQPKAIKNCCRIIVHTAHQVCCRAAGLEGVLVHIQHIHFCCSLDREDTPSVPIGPSTSGLYAIFRITNLGPAPLHSACEMASSTDGPRSSRSLCYALQLLQLPAETTTDMMTSYNCCKTQ